MKGIENLVVRKTVSRKMVLALYVSLTRRRGTNENPCPSIVCIT